MNERLQLIWLPLIDWRQQLTNLHVACMLSVCCDWAFSRRFEIFVPLEV